MNAKTLPAGLVRRPPLRRPLASTSIPRRSACLRADLDDLLTCWCYPTLDERKVVRTTNAIERRFREVRGRARPAPMGTFQDKTSMDRILRLWPRTTGPSSLNKSS